MVWNVFVLGMDELGERLFPKIRHLNDYQFHPLLPLEEAVHSQSYDFDQLLANATADLEAFDGSIDAIVSYWDFPTSVLAPILRRRFGLTGPSVESVLKCEHKYWSRLEQRAVVPDCVPDFQAIDPFSESPLSERQLPYPFWLKPIKAHSSQLGFKVGNDDDFLTALSLIQQGIGRFTHPFEQALAHAEVPETIVASSPLSCLAEEIISAGRQCTMEGYVRNGQMHLTGMVDTHRDEEYPSVLCRYVYPSSLPRSVQDRIFEATRRVMTHIGFDNAPFNIEYFYDALNDAIWLLEINTRLSRSHGAIFHLVDGAPHFQVMIDLALGIEPRMPHREGRYPVAAKHMIRVFHDGIVTRIPDNDTIHDLEQAYPGTVIELDVTTGTRLSELLHQDEFSYELGEIFTGADNETQLDERIRHIEESLAIQVQPI